MYLSEELSKYRTILSENDLGLIDPPGEVSTSSTENDEASIYNDSAAPKESSFDYGDYDGGTNNQGASIYDKTRSTETKSVEKTEEDTPEEKENTPEEKTPVSVSEQMAMYRKYIETELTESWDTKMDTKEKDKGMFKGKTLAELKAELKKCKETPKKTEALKKKEHQLEFAIRAKQKNKWGKIKESIEKHKHTCPECDDTLTCNNPKDCPGIGKNALCGSCSKPTKKTPIKESRKPGPWGQK
jgi:hypothetical protein